MKFDVNSNVVKSCAKGMALEGEGRKEDALQCYQQAWMEAATDFEKFTSAHYVARHQTTILDKLTWDKTALLFALKTEDESMKGAYSSLYLNIAKCYEDLSDFKSANENYELALSFVGFLSDDGYGKMIKDGIINGLERVRFPDNQNQKI